MIRLRDYFDTKIISVLFHRDILLQNIQSQRYMSNSDIIIDILDYEGNRVILTRKKWEQKALQHPELKNKSFLKNLIRTIENPEEVWEDQQDPKSKRCYYRKYSTGTYVKTVIWTQNNLCHVVSAFETNKIKEAMYPRLK